MKQLLDDSNDFITTRKTTALATFYEFLQYVSSDDMVRTNKGVLQQLMMVMAGPSATNQPDPAVQHYIDRVVLVIGHLMSWPILLDQLLPRLSKANLMAESSKLPSSTTISVILSIILVLGSNKQQDTQYKMDPPSDQDKQRIKTNFNQPHLASYLKTSDSTLLNSLF